MGKTKTNESSKGEKKSFLRDKAILQMGGGGRRNQRGGEKLTTVTTDLGGGLLKKRKYNLCHWKTWGGDREGGTEKLVGVTGKNGGQKRDGFRGKFAKQENEKL